MTDENTYTDANGARYVAKDEVAEGFCIGCAFRYQEHEENCNKAPCTENKRADKRDIIWIKESP